MLDAYRWHFLASDVISLQVQDVNRTPVRTKCQKLNQIFIDENHEEFQNSSIRATA